MALERVGIISQEELNQRLNSTTSKNVTTFNSRWTRFDKGRSVNTYGSEGGKITEDWECIDGARVTIEKDGSIAPYSVTLGIYRLMFHTHFSNTEDRAKEFRDFSIEKIDELFALYDTAESQRDETWHANHNRLVNEIAEQ